MMDVPAEKPDSARRREPRGAGCAPRPPQQAVLAEVVAGLEPRDLLTLPRDGIDVRRGHARLAGEELVACVALLD